MDRRKLEEERRLEIAQKRAATSSEGMNAVSRDGGKQATRGAGLGVEEGEDSEPESDVAGAGGDSSSDESEELEKGKINGKVATEVS